MSDNENTSYPNHWKSQNLGDVLKVVRGVSFPSEDKKLSFAEDHIVCLRTANVQEDVDWQDLWYIPEEHVSRGEQYVKSEDILISTANSYELVGKVALVRNLRERATLGAFISLIRVPEGFSSKFVFYQLRSTAIRNEMRQRASTTTNISNISTSNLKEIPHYFPPLPEQRRIVAKIEELFSNLDAGMGELSVAEQQLERYRLSVLQAAVEGRLTADWRRTHDPEPADQLLERILEARENSDYHRKPKLEKFEEGFPPEIPDSWIWTRVGAVCYVRGGKAFRSKNYEEEGIPLIRISNIQDQKVSFEKNTVHLPASFSDEHGRYLMRNGDIVIAMSGATTGKLGVFEGEDDSAFLNQRVGRFEFFDEDLVSEEYFLYYLLTIQDDILRDAYGAAQPNISATAISNFALPLPPLAEQKQIVAEVERLLSVSDDASATTKQEQTRAERLRQSILKQAFSGNLVPHEDGDPVARANGKADPDMQMKMDL